jgi:SOS-response transcriptional repressor LexA
MPRPRKTYLTELQFDVWEYTAKFIAKYSYAPTRREIAEGIKVAPSTVHHILMKLAALGIISIGERTSRTIVVHEPYTAENRRKYDRKVRPLDSRDGADQGTDRAVPAGAGALPGE